MAILKKLAWIFRWTTSPVSGIGLIPWQNFLHWVGPTESETSGMFWRSLIALLLPGVIVPHTELIAVLIPAIEYGLKTLNALAAHGTPKVCPNIYWHKLQTECLPDLVVSLPTMSFFWSRPLFLSLSYAKIHWWYGQGQSWYKCRAHTSHCFKPSARTRGLCQFRCLGPQDQIM